jgi:hypothetical protein
MSSEVVTQLETMRAKARTVDSEQLFAVRHRRW